MFTNGPPFFVDDHTIGDADSTSLLGNFKYKLAPVINFSDIVQANDTSHVFC